jgi:hypothetical protein
MTDQIDPQSIEVTGGSADVLNWPATVTITRVTLSPQEVSFDAIGLIRWPHVTPPGWDGGIQSTLWIVVKGPDGRWRSTGSIEFYAGRSGTGSPLSSGSKDWWYYAPEIGQPQPGDVVGLFLAAGDQRRKDVRSVDERSNIVTFTVPPNDSGSFTFADAPAPPVPQPDPEPTAVPSDLTMQLDRIEAAIASEAAKDEAFRIEVHAFTEELVRELKIVAGRFGL